MDPTNVVWNVQIRSQGYIEIEDDPALTTIKKPKPSNKIKTSQYTVYNFLPKNLLLQFSKMANVFYIIIAFLQMIPLISITGGKPVMLVPLSFVIFVSMIKDISEDYKRHKSDRKENLSKVLIMDVDSGEFNQHTWEEVQVGSVVKILENNYFPADLILVDSSEANG